MDTLTALLCLSGTTSWSHPLLHAPVPFLVPFVNQPLIKQLLLLLKKAQVERVVFILDDLSSSWLYPQRAELAHLGLILDYILLRHLYEPENNLQDELLDRLPLDQPVLLLQDPFPDLVDMASFLQFHREHQADCSVRLLPGRASQGILRPVYLNQEGLVSLQAQNGLRPAQDTRMYLLETDILEDLFLARVPLLKHSLSEYFCETMPYYYGFVAPQPLCMWQTLPEYLAMQKLFSESVSIQPEGQILKKQGETVVWVGEGSSYESLPECHGMVLIGRHCRIERNVILKGPVFVGDHVQIGASTQLHQVTLWRHARVGPRCHIENSLIATRGYVAFDCRIKGALLAEHSQLGIGQQLQAGDMLGPFSRLGMD